MAQFTLVFVGKIKEPFAHVYDFYAKRFSLETKILKSRKQLMAYTKKPFVLVTEKGEAFDSRAFAQWIKEQTQPMIFLIGDDNGFPAEIEHHSNVLLRLRLSAMTFPHDLAKVMLVEQLYRATTILQNKQYHK